jgi:hypothetical protein
MLTHTVLLCVALLQCVEEEQPAAQQRQQQQRREWSDDEDEAMQDEEEEEEQDEAAADEAQQRQSSRQQRRKRPRSAGLAAAAGDGAGGSSEGAAAADAEGIAPPKAKRHEPVRWSAASPCVLLLGTKSRFICNSYLITLSIECCSCTRTVQQDCGEDFAGPREHWLFCFVFLPFNLTADHNYLPYSATLPVTPRLLSPPELLFLRLCCCRRQLA